MMKKKIDEIVFGALKVFKIFMNDLRLNSVYFIIEIKTVYNYLLKIYFYYRDIFFNKHLFLVNKFYRFIDIFYLLVKNYTIFIFLYWKNEIEELFYSVDNVTALTKNFYNLNFYSKINITKKVMTNKEVIFILNRRQKTSFYLASPSIYPFVISAILGGILLMFTMFLHKETGIISLFSLINIVSLISLIVAISFWVSTFYYEKIVGEHTTELKKNITLGFYLFMLTEILCFLALFWVFLHSLLSASLHIGLYNPGEGITNFYVNETIIFNESWNKVNFSSLGVPHTYKTSDLNTNKIDVFLTSNKFVHINFFDKGQLVDPYKIPLYNTIILLSSAAMLNYSHKNMRLGKYFVSSFSLFLTILIGLVFVFLQFKEYKLCTMSFFDGIYACAFYSLTGLHGFHVMIGITSLIICLVNSLKKNYTAVSHQTFEFSIWYWHFVDVVWIAVYLIIYLWPAAYFFKTGMFGTVYAENFFVVNFSKNHFYWMVAENYIQLKEKNAKDRLYLKENALTHFFGSLKNEANEKFFKNVNYRKLQKSLLDYSNLTKKKNINNELFDKELFDKITTRNKMYLNKNLLLSDFSKPVTILEKEKPLNFACTFLQTFLKDKIKNEEINKIYSIIFSPVSSLKKEIILNFFNKENTISKNLEFKKSNLSLFIISNFHLPNKVNYFMKPASYDSLNIAFVEKFITTVFDKNKKISFTIDYKKLFHTKTFSDIFLENTNTKKLWFQTFNPVTHKTTYPVPIFLCNTRRISEASIINDFFKIKIAYLNSNEFANNNLMFKRKLVYKVCCYTPSLLSESQLEETMKLNKKYSNIQKIKRVLLSPEYVNKSFKTAFFYPLISATSSNDYYLKTLPNHEKIFIINKALKCHNSFLNADFFLEKKFSNKKIKITKNYEFINLIEFINSSKLNASSKKVFHTDNTIIKILNHLNFLYEIKKNKLRVSILHEETLLYFLENKDKFNFNLIKRDPVFFTFFLNESFPHIKYFIKKSKFVYLNPLFSLDNLNSICNFFFVGVFSFFIFLFICIRIILIFFNVIFFNIKNSNYLLKIISLNDILKIKLFLPKINKFFLIN